MVDEPVMTRNGTTLNAVESVVGRAPEEALSVYPIPTLSMLRSSNVATPAETAFVVVPESVPPPGLF